MNKDGFTLVEIVVAIAILVSLGLVIGAGINKVYLNKVDDDIKEFHDKIHASTDLYMANNDSLTSLLYTTRGFIKITVDDLITSGLLARGVIDPETGEVVDSNNNVTVSLGPEGLLKIEYNKKDPDGPYLEAQTLSIKAGSSFNCTSASTYASEWGTYNLRLINTDGNVSTSYIDNVITNISCSGNVTAPGTYKIDYTYKVPGHSSSKVYTRNIVVTP